MAHVLLNPLPHASLDSREIEPVFLRQALDQIGELALERRLGAARLGLRRTRRPFGRLPISSRSSSRYCGTPPARGGRRVVALGGRRRLTLEARRTTKRGGAGVIRARRSRDPGGCGSAVDIGFGWSSAGVSGWIGASSSPAESATSAGDTLEPLIVTGVAQRWSLRLDAGSENACHWPAPHRKSKALAGAGSRSEGTGCSDTTPRACQFDERIGARRARDRARPSARPRQLQLNLRPALTAERRARAATTGRPQPHRPARAPPFARTSRSRAGRTTARPARRRTSSATRAPRTRRMPTA